MQNLSTGVMCFGVLVIAFAKELLTLDFWLV